MKFATLTFARAVLDWLRAGYPAGLPRQDYVAIYGLLHRRLTGVEIAEVAEAIGPSDGKGEQVRNEVAAEIERVAMESAGDDDVDRVCAHLAANYRRSGQPDNPAAGVQPPS